MRSPIVLIACFMMWSCAESVNEKDAATTIGYQLQNKIKDAIAGDAIILRFSSTDVNSKALLLVTNTYGTTLLPAKQEGQNSSFTLPRNITRKAGPCQWALLLNGKALIRGQFNIAPKTSENSTLETYFGPRSITAGNEDYSMLVSVVTDPYDNPWPEKTIVDFKSQFLESINEYSIPTSDFIAWKNIFATQKSGRILVTNSHLNTSSKELTTIVFPALAQTFQIKVKQNHKFADGNQVINFYSTSIKDQYGNSISDGTLVNFIVKNSKGSYLKAVSATIGGIAKANMLHPSEKDTWQITAYVTGAAKSNTISTEFETAISDFEIQLTKNNRVLTVGPLTSFMNQLVPDGILLQLDMYDSKMNFLESKKLNSVNGIGIFELPAAYHPNGKYHLVLKVAGITKTYDLELNEK